MRLTENGLVLIDATGLMQITFKHLVTSLDDDQSDSQFDCGRVANLTGYTEWLSENHPYLTIGWDWVIDARDQFRVPRRLGTPRTNVNLVGEDDQALPWNESLEQLGKLMETLLPWQQTVYILGEPKAAEQTDRPSLTENI